MRVVVYDDGDDGWLANEEFYRRELLARLRARRDAVPARPAPMALQGRLAGPDDDPVHVDRRPRRGEWVTPQQPSERALPMFMAVHGEPDVERVVEALSRAGTTLRASFTAVGL